MEKKDNDKDKPKFESFGWRFLALLASLINLVFAYYGGLMIFKHVAALFVSNPVVGFQMVNIVLGIILLGAGILGCRLSLHLLFFRTKFAKYFPGFF